MKGAKSFEDATKTADAAIAKVIKRDGLAGKAPKK